MPNDMGEFGQTLGLIGTSLRQARQQDLADTSRFLWSALSGVDFAPTGKVSDPAGEGFRRGALWAAGTVLAAYSGGSTDATAQATIPAVQHGLPTVEGCVSAVRNVGRACWYLTPGRNLTVHAADLLSLAAAAAAADADPKLPGALWAAGELVSSYTATRGAAEEQVAGAIARQPLCEDIVEILAQAAKPLSANAIRLALCGPYGWEVAPEVVASALCDELSGGSPRVRICEDGGYLLAPSQPSPETVATSSKRRVRRRGTSVRSVKHLAAPAEQTRPERPGLVRIGNTTPHVVLERDLAGHVSIEAPAAKLEVSITQHSALLGITTNPTTSQDLRRRAQFVLLASQGQTDAQLAQLFDISPGEAANWRQSIVDRGVTTWLNRRV